jgi:hypothetical protein
MKFIKTATTMDAIEKIKLPSEKTTMTNSLSARILLGILSGATLFNKLFGGSKPFIH